MKELILIKQGELFLKGLNKKEFEKKLLKDIKLKLSKFGEFSINASQSVISINPVNINVTLDEVLETLQNVFGIALISKAVCCKKNIDDIKIILKNYFKDKLIAAKTFKIESKRADKSFPLKSYDLSAKLGEYLLNEFKHLKVDVHSPDLVIHVEIRDLGVYIKGNQIKGIGGLPIGSCGRVLSLISGGIDSPVASFMMAKRGTDVLMLHFVSPPYTSEKAKDKVISILKKLNKYLNKTKLLVVSLTKIQEAIKKSCKEEYFTLILRRFMIKIAENIALENNCKALVTGESLGQVASQTLGAILCSNSASKYLPILRPLIGMDKNEIVKIANKIDTFETSILPYEDCCTVFVPKHPKTRPVLEDVLKEEKKLDENMLINDALKSLTIEEIY